jgi:hypothetical protein
MVRWKPQKEKRSLQVWRQVSIVILILIAKHICNWKLLFWKYGQKSNVNGNKLTMTQ